MYLCHASSLRGLGLLGQSQHHIHCPIRRSKPNYALKGYASLTSDSYLTCVKSSKCASRFALVADRRSLLVASAIANAAPAGESEVLSTQHNEDQGLTISVTKGAGAFTVRVASHTDRPDLGLYWGVDDWAAPDPSCWPPGTFDSGGGKAVQTPFGSSREVIISFPEESCPARVVFVLREGEKWMNNGGGDFAAYLKPPGVTELIEKVITAETEFDRWSLFSRFMLATQLLDAAIVAGPEGMGLMLTWLRLSTLRLLPWYKGTNYQSKDAAHVQKVLAQRMADAARSAADPRCRLLARCCLACLPRGGGNGDDIRHGILNIMREHGIKEGHRPGIKDDFLETWHQKLHTNTTPEDVTICEAYLAYLSSGDMGEFWRVAWERGRLTPETLANMDHPVNPSPCHLPQLIPAMKHYLWILKTTHAGADLDVAFEMTRGRLDGDLAWAIGDLLSNRNEWWVPGKIVEVRRRLEGYWRADGAPRDILLLDIALDAYFRLCIERSDKAAMSPDNLFNIAQLVLENASIATESEELRATTSLWRRVGETPGRWEEGGEWGSRALAAADNAALCLEAHADGIAEAVQPHAERFGAACGIDPAYILNFSEEVVRSQPVFILSPLLQSLGPSLRAAAGVGSWQVASQGSAGIVTGRLSVMPDLEGVQGKALPEPTVIVADRLTGNEDIPENVVAVLTASPTDVLSHVAIRARAQGVLLATCFDPEQLETVRAMMQGVESPSAYVELSISPSGDVCAGPAAVPPPGAAGADSLEGSTSSREKIKVSTPSGAKKGAKTPWVVTEAEFTAGLVGGKALNLASLRGKLPSDVGMPSSIALPFGTLERVLADPANAETAKLIVAAEKELKGASVGGGVPPALNTLRSLVGSKLTAPAELVQAVAKAAGAAGLVKSPTEWTDARSDSWKAAWTAICGVWASKWNDRAWLSRKAQSVPESDLFMCVLLQTIIPARYAFVLHTADPLTGAAGSLHGEVVAGMGEALVGNFPGRPLSFSCDTTSTSPSPQKPTLIAMPSKRDGLWAVGENPLIARSDSNGEDLENFAGAGLYDSIPFTPLQRGVVNYSEEALVWDSEFRTDLLGKLAKVGLDIETLCGCAQDVEGVVDADGGLYVVQARAQVL